jgi:galactitol 2-dehydrogenase
VLSPKASIDNCVKSVVAMFGRIDILINNAAIFDAATIVEISRTSYQRVFDVNVGGTLFMMQVRE